MNWAHLLTAIRLALAPLCAWACVQEWWTLAAAAFTTAAVSDYYDGKVARAQGAQSAFGGLFDHATDAIFVSVTLWSLAHLGLVSQWLPWLVAAAFIQYTLDSEALKGAVLRANWLGRTNGIGYFVLCGIGIGSSFLLDLDLFNTVAPLSATFAWIQAPLTYWLSLLLIATTMVSMLNRLRYWLQLRS